MCLIEISRFITERGLIKLRGKIMKRIPTGHITEQACCEGKRGGNVQPCQTLCAPRLERSEVFRCTLRAEVMPASYSCLEFGVRCSWSPPGSASCPKSLDQSHWIMSSRELTGAPLCTFVPEGRGRGWWRKACRTHREALSLVGTWRSGQEQPDQRL